MKLAVAGWGCKNWDVGWISDPFYYFLLRLSPLIDEKGILAIPALFLLVGFSTWVCHNWTLRGNSFDIDNDVIDSTLKLVCVWIRITPPRF